MNTNSALSLSDPITANATQGDSRSLGDSGTAIVASSSAWANINWAASYSSDEESQSSSPSRCLFPDHLLADEDDGDAAAGLTPPLSPSPNAEDTGDLVFILEPSPLVDPVVFVPTPEFTAPLYDSSVSASFSSAPATSPSPLPPPPPRTRRRTHSQILATLTGSTDVRTTAYENSVSGTGAAQLDAAADASLLQLPNLRPLAVRNHYPRHSVIPAARSLWVTAALVTTVLMFGDVHPNGMVDQRSGSHDIGTSSQSFENHEAASSFVAPFDLAGGMPAPNLRGERLPPSSVLSSSSTSTRFMHAVGAKSAPLTFRADTRSRPSESYLFHALYVSLCSVVVLWSAREIQREVRERRRAVRQESICDLL